MICFSASNQDILSQFKVINFYKFNALDFKHMFVIHFELLFVYNVSNASRFIFLHTNIQLTSRIFIRKS